MGIPYSHKPAPKNIHEDMWVALKRQDRLTHCEHCAKKIDLYWCMDGLPQTLCAPCKGNKLRKDPEYLKVTFRKHENNK